tara:strand:+ start:125 stop:688 length:564 start_codon:yes stop_codon:yes gene_type:complete
MDVDLKRLDKGQLIKFNKILRRLKVSDIYIDRAWGSNYYHEQVFNDMHNENMIMLVIENMGIAFTMCKYMANQFGYLKDVALKYGEAKHIFHYKINIYYIDNKWDTNNWSLHLLKRFHSMMDACERKSLEELRNRKPTNNFNLDFVDIPFLEAMGWESPHIEEIRLRQQNPENSAVPHIEHLEPVPY